MRDLIVLNDLKPPFTLKSGQKLVLPVSIGDVAPTPEPFPSGDIERTPLITTPEATSSAASHAILPAPVTMGTVEELNTPPPPPKAVTTTASTAPVEKPKTISPPPTQAPTSTSAPSPIPAPSPAPVTTTPITLSWPVQGPVLSGFGSKGKGLVNDGVNIGAPKGSPVTAAGNGIVVYAGNEMKGFGNLILIRHEGDWVTAYAYLDRILVSKDSTVAKGDMIGTVGKSGDAATPQIHFETRYKGKPVDPKSTIKE